MSFFSVPHPSSLPPTRPPPISVSLLLSPLLPLASLHLREKGDAFCDFFFLAGFSLCSDIVQKCMMGNWRGSYFLPQLFVILWTNSSRGLGERDDGQRREEEQGTGHQKCFFVLFCFVWILKIMILKINVLETMQWRRAAALTRMAWISLRMSNSWRGPMIECVWLSLAAPCPVR